MKRSERRSLEYLVIEHNRLAHITFQIAEQLEPRLPIVSFEKLAEDMAEIVVDEHRLPLKMFAPHVADSLFPIENIEDLVRTLSAGVRSAVALVQTPSFRIKNLAALEILATLREAEPGRRSGIPVAYASGFSRQINQGGE